MGDNSAVQNNQTAFRGYASLAIVIGHLLFIPIYDMGFAHYEDWGQMAKLVFFRFLAVDGFFLLSGCVLALHYWDAFTQATKGREIDRFYLKRLARIYPMHLFALGLVAVYALCGVAHPIASGLQDKIFEHWQWTGLLNLVLMQGWGIVPVASWNEPSWTLSVLFMLYVLFPNLVLMMKRLPFAAAGWLWFVLGLIAAYAALRMWVPLGSNSDGAGALLRGLVMFIAGMALARLHISGWKAGWHWDKGFAVALTTLLALMIGWWAVARFDLWPMHLVLAVMVFCLMRADGRMARVFANPVSLWLGKISFSLYILHYPIMMGLKHVAGEDLAALAATGAMGKAAAYIGSIGAVLLLGYLGWRFVERPLSRWLRAGGKAKF